MADDHFLPGLENLKHTLSLADIDQFINNFPVTNNPTHQQPIGLNNILDNLFPDNLLHQSHENSGNYPGLFIHENNNQATNDNDNLDVKRKAMEIISPANSSPQVSDNGIGRKNGARKRVKGNNEKKEEKPREVIHVRAKRGQATDSHSLAERVRREKINERLRCLQDIVPGCYKAMGMAVMLDEIINYVQSLQNQVEFLSMKLTAASTFYDFNSETETLETIQIAKAFEALNGQNGARTGLTSAQFAPLGLNFEHYSQLPQNK
ncbi:hypothetical protein CASFOL_035294 [Castilleja foliolosa]|uniref:BHLH domain-containing protein n=1 Tax=Castilleja foliolosa TaxID=1961234 RepID=A0ABD3BSY2_9LAMI